jgi:hypothetical protein
MLMIYSLFWDGKQRKLVVTDVSGQPIGPIFKGQSVQEFCLTLENESDRLPRNGGNYQSTLHNIPEELRSHLHHGQSLKSCIVNDNEKVKDFVHRGSYVQYLLL